jgi:hypothetical protein
MSGIEHEEWVEVKKVMWQCDMTNATRVTQIVLIQFGLNKFIMYLST